MKFQLSPRLWTAAISGTLLACLLMGCATDEPTTQKMLPTTAPASTKGSAQLWSETCMRCHNVRSPSAYSADQWQVILHDMRIRGQLTGQEQRQICEFLKSAN